MVSGVLVESIRRVKFQYICHYGTTKFLYDTTQSGHRFEILGARGGVGIGFHWFENDCGIFGLYSTHNYILGGGGDIVKCRGWPIGTGSTTIIIPAQKIRLFFATDEE
jgi:hypothetical protein